RAENSSKSSSPPWNSLRSSELGATSLSHSSWTRRSFFTPRGHSRSTSTRRSPSAGPSSSSRSWTRSREIVRADMAGSFRRAAPGIDGAAGAQGTGCAGREARDPARDEESRPGPAGRAVSGEHGRGGLVVGLLGDLGDLLGVQDRAVGVGDDDRAGEQTRERPVLHGHAEVLAEAGAEGGAGDDVLDALGAAEACLREGQVLRDADDDGVLEAGGELVE